MLGRPAASSREFINIENHFKLIDTLSTFLPPEWCQRFTRHVPSTVPLGQSLLWFNTSMPADQLLPDGTDPLQSPGEPWVRRMWAGGRMKLNAHEYYRLDTGFGFAMESDIACAERIQDVELVEAGGRAMIFVTLERRFTRVDTLREKLRSRSASVKRFNPHELFREQLLSPDWGDAILQEERRLVFLKGMAPAELEAMKAKRSAQRYQC
jgi:hydroxyacyl-ACP dehydratase HTD2-like protein with hotdog domain